MVRQDGPIEVAVGEPASPVGSRRIVDDRTVRGADREVSPARHRTRVAQAGRLGPLAGPVDSPSVACHDVAMIAAFSLTPLGVGPSVSEPVAEAVRLVRSSGLPNQTNAM